MVRQWQQLLHGNRLSNSYCEATPDFVKLAEAYGARGLRCEHPGDLAEAMKALVDSDGPAVLDCRVAALENCFPMIPSGRAHNDMTLPDEASDARVASLIDAEGAALV
jgi:acetolactate synthase-1/2/3 large subunit